VILAAIVRGFASRAHEAGLTFADKTTMRCHDGGLVSSWELASPYLERSAPAEVSHRHKRHQRLVKCLPSRYGAHYGPHQLGE
jgi:hypothetical protein